MDAFRVGRRVFSLIVLISLVVLPISSAKSQVTGTAQYSASTANFRVYATDPQLAKHVAEVAEENRKQLALHWLGYELPRWSAPCPVVVVDGPSRLASGETKYTLVQGAVINFHMTVVGTRERILDSVLPHEITHTIMASHFAPLGKPIPRWADEGMCTTVEHESERRKHDQMLVRFIREGKGIPFGYLLVMRDYPPDMLPLYAEGYSVTSFLVSQAGPKAFIKFLEVGMKDEDWGKATREIFGYPLVSNMQSAWNDWVADGGGAVTEYTALARGYRTESLVASLTQNSGGVVNALAVSSQNSLNPSAAIENGVAMVSPSNSSTVRTASGFTPDQNARNNSMRRSDASLNLPTENGSVYLGMLRNQQQASGTGGVNSSSIESQIGRPTIADESLKNPGTVVNQSAGPSSSIPHTVSQPAPMQTIGGGVLRR